MSLWTSIRDKVIRPVIGAASSAIPFVGPAISAAIQKQPSYGQFGASMGMASLPSIIPAAGTIARNLPTIAGTIGRATTAGAAAKYVYDSLTGQYKPIRKRRAKGITASQLKGFKRVAKVLHDYQKVAVKHKVKAPTRRCR